jgi:hypothetical protein
MPLEIYIGSTSKPGNVVTATIVHRTIDPSAWVQEHVKASDAADPNGQVYDLHVFSGTYVVALMSTSTETWLLIKDGTTWSNLKLTGIINAPRVYVRAKNDVLILGCTPADTNDQKLWHWNGTNVAQVLDFGFQTNFTGGLDGSGPDYVMVLPNGSGAVLFTGGDVRTPGNWAAIARPAASTDVRNLTVVSPTEAYAGIFVFSGGTNSVWFWNGTVWAATGGFPSSAQGSRCFAIARDATGKLWAAGTANPSVSGAGNNPGIYTKAPAGSWVVDHLFANTKEMHFNAATDTDPNHVAFGGRVEEAPGAGVYQEYLDGSSFTRYVTPPLPAGSVNASAVDLIESNPEAPVVIPVDPTRDALDADVDAVISFRIEDEGTLEEPWKVAVNRGNGWELAMTVSGGAPTFEAGFDGPRSALTVTDVYSVVIHPTEEFEFERRVFVAIAARDDEGLLAIVEGD